MGCINKKKHININKNKNFKNDENFFSDIKTNEDLNIFSFNNINLIIWKNVFKYLTINEIKNILFINRIFFYSGKIFIKNYKNNNIHKKKKNYIKKNIENLNNLNEINNITNYGNLIQKYTNEIIKSNNNINMNQTKNNNIYFNNNIMNQINHNYSIYKNINNINNINNVSNSSKKLKLNSSDTNSIYYKDIFTNNIININAKNTIFSKNITNSLYNSSNSFYDQTPSFSEAPLSNKKSILTITNITNININAPPNINNVNNNKINNYVDDKNNVNNNNNYVDGNNNVNNNNNYFYDKNNVNNSNNNYIK